MAFEADDIDPVSHTGWSVLVQGLATVIVEPGEVERARTLGLEPWAPSAQRQFIRIRAELVSGRRLVPRPVRKVYLPAPVARIELPQFAGCPACGSQEMLPVSDGATRNYICNTCAACWRLEGTELRRVRPETCPGCLLKPMCTAAAARDGVVAEVTSLR